MPLTDLWNSSKDQFENKHISQIIAFAGNGELKDGNVASAEFREFLSNIPTRLLSTYSDQCLNESFNSSGLALQDIMNQAGKRLGFEVVDGRYRGTQTAVGFDGIWFLPNGHAIIIEVKTTDAYSINLDTLNKYRRTLSAENQIPDDKSSILIIVGRHDTGNLEAQIRGSRYAWDIRVISVDALLRLLSIKETVEDPSVLNRIHAILIPREFTKLDEIIDIIFSTTEDIKQEPDNPLSIESIDKPENTAPVSFHNLCIARVEYKLGITLVQKTRTSYATFNNSILLTCSTSKEYIRGKQITYWFAFHPYQKEFLVKCQKSYVVLGCGSESQTLLIPGDEFINWLPEMLTTNHNDRLYWHVSITKDENFFILHRKRGAKWIDLTNYLI